MESGRGFDESVSEVSVVGFDSGDGVSGDLEKLNRKVDSIVDWISQFYERFLYLDNQVSSIRVQEGLEGEDYCVSDDVARLDVELSDLSRKFEESRFYFEEKLRGILGEDAGFGDEVSCIKMEILGSEGVSDRSRDSFERQREKVGIGKLRKSSIRGCRKLVEDKVSGNGLEVGSKEWLKDVRKRK